MALLYFNNFRNKYPQNTLVKTALLNMGLIYYNTDRNNEALEVFDQLLTNYTALIDAIVKARPAAVKGQYIKSISLATTMGPGVKVVCNRY